MDPHRLAELRSIALHRAVAEKLRAQPELVARARERVHRALSARTTHSEYGRAWLRLLELPPDALADRLSEPSEEMCALRQTSPFAGILDARERWTIWRRVAEEAADDT